jgi:hypothetical protein
VSVVRGRRRAVVGGVGQVAGLVLLLVVPALPEVATVEPVRDVAARAGRRVVAEEVAEQAPEAVHRNGL